MPAVSEKQRAALERQVDLGAGAAAVLDRAAKSCPTCGAGSSIFRERKEHIVREAIDWFRSPAATSDAHVAVRYIAALAEIVALEDALEYRARKAEDARVALYRTVNEKIGTAE